MGLVRGGGFNQKLQTSTRNLGMLCFHTLDTSVVVGEYHKHPVRNLRPHQGNLSHQEYKHPPYEEFTRLARD